MELEVAAVRPGLSPTELFVHLVRVLGTVRLGAAPKIQEVAAWIVHRIQAPVSTVCQQPRAGVLQGILQFYRIPGRQAARHAPPALTFRTPT